MTDHHDPLPLWGGGGAGADLGVPVHYAVFGGPAAGPRIVLVPSREKEAGRRRWVVGLGFLLGATLVLLTIPTPASATPAGPSARPRMPIEQRYEHTGSHPVTTQIVTDPASGGTFALYYPSNLADTTHPIVTWGNGTGAHPQDYDTLLRHLASWGFVVIDSTNSQTGNGTDMLAGATYLLHRNATSGDQFHNRIDTAHIAAVGHSQGATGALNATRLSNGMITTTVPIGLPTKASIAGLAPLPADVHGLTG